MRRRHLVLVVALAAVLAGCDNTVPDTTGLSPFPSAPSAAPQPSLSVPPATHTWKSDGLTCPTLSGPEAQASGLSGAGQRVRGTDSEGSGNLLFCHWGPDDGTAPSADLELSTTREPGASDGGWQLLGRLFTTPLPGVGEQAFISPDLGSGFGEFKVTVRSGNAILSITLQTKKGDTASTGRLRGNAAAISAEMLSSLVPA